MDALSAAVAAELVAAQALRARRARTSAAPERWMEAEAVTAVEELTGHGAPDVAPS